MVDNRYTGVGYDPPFETPSDKDFMAAHIDQLKAEAVLMGGKIDYLESHIAELEAELKLTKDKLKLLENVTGYKVA